MQENSDSAFSKETNSEFSRWMAKFTAEEQRILENRYRRLQAIREAQRAEAKQFGDLCEATEGLAKYWRDHNMLTAERLIAYADGDLLCLQLMLPTIRRLATRLVNRLQTYLTRPLRYEKENETRRRLAAERRKIRERTTSNPCPTRFDVFEAWMNRKKSPADYLRLGALLEDLECYVDNSLQFSDDGVILGRSSGIKGWVQLNLGAMQHVYSTLMRSKAVAKRLRQIANLNDPLSLLPTLPPPTPDDSIPHPVPAQNATTPRSNSQSIPSSVPSHNVTTPQINSPQPALLQNAPATQNNPRPPENQISGRRELTPVQITRLDHSAKTVSSILAKIPPRRINLKAYLDDIIDNLDPKSHQPKTA